jgi:hypothetical protein
MRRRLIASAAVVLALLAGTAVTAQETARNEDAGKTAKRGNWFTRLFSFGKRGEEQAPGAAALGNPQTVLEATAAQRSRELAAYYRRQAVCLRLLEIAAETRDESLRQRVELLEARSFDLYLKRTAVGSVEGLSGNFEDRLLEQQLTVGRGSSTGSSRAQVRGEKR